MSKLNLLKHSVKKISPAVLGVSAFAVAGSAFADTAASINTAVTDATSNVGLVASGLIAIAAVMMGVGIIVSAMKR